MIVADFNPKIEASAIAGMVKRGVMTHEEARELILMTPGQAQYLVRKKIAPPRIVQFMQARRQRTWILFQENLGYA